MDRRNKDVVAKGVGAAAHKSGRKEIDQFLKQVAAMPQAPRGAGTRGRLLFGMDATASREPTWDVACHIQGEMFHATHQLGGLDVKLAFYRGMGELKASPWTATGSELARLMTGVRCLAGRTQVGPMLAYAARESRDRKIDALVFVGDCFEEDIDSIGEAAGQLGMLGTPAFMFHEGFDQSAERAFRQIARLTKGAYVRFDLTSAGELKRLLGAVAAYAAGGRAALLDYGSREGGAALLLTSQMK